MLGVQKGREPVLGSSPRGPPPTALLLVSDPSAYMTNVVIALDGGTSARRDRARMTETPDPAEAETDRSIRIHD